MDKEQQQLILKVMRLSRASLIQSTTPFYIEPASSALRQGQDALTRLQETDAQILGLCYPSSAATGSSLVSSNKTPAKLSSMPASTVTMDLLTGEPTATFQTDSIEPRLRDFSLGSMLTLPSSFGNIYLGETFSCYLCLSNDSSTVSAADVDFKAELQTNTQRFPLYDNRESARASQVNLAQHQSLEAVVHHDIKELGVHILVCNIQYTGAQGERKSFRKFYKFQVLNPLAVKTKTHSDSSQIFLEAQIQNQTGAPMVFEQLVLVPADGYECQDLNQNAQGESVFGRDSYLKSQDIRQYLFRLTPKPGADSSLIRNTTALGKLDFVWRTTMGEQGRLQTSSLGMRQTSLPALEVILERMPKDIYLEEPFRVVFRATNHLDKVAQLKLVAVKSKMNGILVMGAASVSLGEVQPESSVSCELSLFPLMPGLQKIEGFELVDEFSGDQSSLGVLAEVYVQRGASMIGH